MTTDNQTLVEPNIEPETALSPGVILSQARERTHLTIDDVASSLRLRGSVIQAIENDDYSKITRHVFARGYLRAYARLVHVDADKVVSSFDTLNLMGDESVKTLWKTPKTSITTMSPNTKKSSNPVKWLFILVGMCLFVFAGMWLNANRMKPNGNALSTAFIIQGPIKKSGIKVVLEQDSLDDNFNLKGKVS